MPRGVTLPRRPPRRIFLLAKTRARVLAAHMCAEGVAAAAVAAADFFTRRNDARVLLQRRTAAPTMRRRRPTRTFLLAKMARACYWTAKFARASPAPASPARMRLSPLFFGKKCDCPHFFFGKKKLKNQCRWDASVGRVSAIQSGRAAIRFVPTGAERAIFFTKKLIFSTWKNGIRG